MTSDIPERSRSNDITKTDSTELTADGDAPDIKATSLEQRDPYPSTASRQMELREIRRRSRSWIETLHASKAQVPLTVKPDVARSLARAGVPDAVTALLPADFRDDPWLIKLLSLPGVPHASYEYVSTKMTFVALGERGIGNKAARLTRLMRGLGWKNASCTHT